MRVGANQANRVAGELGLLTSNQVCFAASVTYRMLDHYVNMGFIAPTHGNNAPGSGYARLFDPDIVNQVINLRHRIEACPFHPHDKHRSARPADNNKEEQCP